MGARPGSSKNKSGHLPAFGELQTSSGESCAVRLVRARLTLSVCAVRTRLVEQRLWRACAAAVCGWAAVMCQCVNVCYSYQKNIKIAL